MRRRPCSLVASTVGLAVAVAGCDTPSLFFPPGTARPAGRDFASAPLIELDESQKATISGRAALDQTDVWDLGPMAAGDRVHVTVRAAFGSTLDPTSALFDADQDLFAVNDDLDLRTGRLESVIDKPVRTAADHFYLAVSASFFSSQSGGYTAEIEVARGGAGPTPARQKLLLNFEGGRDVDIRNVGIFDIDPFNAADVDPDYEDATDAIRDDIVAIVRDRLAPYDVLVLESGDGTPAEGPDYSTLYFGRFSRTAFGISEQVDTWNADACDDGIIYTDRFDDAFAVKPTNEGIAVAIAQVAVHEAGHLLGLSHVADVTDLMDTTGTASTLLVRQDFKRSLLDRSIFPLGHQNGPKLLFDTVGAAP